MPIDKINPWQIRDPREQAASEGWKTIFKALMDDGPIPEGDVPVESQGIGPAEFLVPQNLAAKGAGLAAPLIAGSLKNKALSAWVKAKMKAMRGQYNEAVGIYDEAVDRTAELSAVKDFGGRFAFNPEGDMRALDKAHVDMETAERLLGDLTSKEVDLERDLVRRGVSQDEILRNFDELGVRQIPKHIRHQASKELSRADKYAPLVEDHTRNVWWAIKEQGQKYDELFEIEKLMQNAEKMGLSRPDLQDAYNKRVVDFESARLLEEDIQKKLHQTHYPEFLEEGGTQEEWEQLLGIISDYIESEE